MGSPSHNLEQRMLPAKVELWTENSNTKRSISTAFARPKSPVINKNVKRIKLLPNAKVNEMRDEYALHVAIKDNRIATVDALLNRGADVNARKSEDIMPINVASMKGDTIIDETCLIKRVPSATAEAKSLSGYTPLHCAVEVGSKEITELLLKKNACVDAKTGNGWTPLAIAVNKGNAKIAEMLLDRDAEINPLSGQHPLHVAVKKNRLEIVDFLLNRGADVNARNSEDMTSINVASMKGDRIIDETCLTKRVTSATVEAKSLSGYTPLHCAVEVGSKEIIELLLKKNACVDAKAGNGWTPLAIAVNKGNMKLAEMLLDRDGGINPSSGQHPLHVAIQKNRLEFVDFLLNRGADVNARDCKDMTPIHVASMKGQLVIVEKLLNTGASVNSVVNETNKWQGCTPLHCAVMADSQEIVELLLKNNACIDTITKTNLTPLDIAIIRVHKGRTENVDLVKLLLKHGANVYTGVFTRKIFTNTRIRKSVVAQILVSLFSDHKKANRSFLIDAVDTSEMVYVNILDNIPTSRMNFTVDSENPYKFNALIQLFLHTAVAKGHLRVIDDFLKVGIDANAFFEKDSNGTRSTLLHTAAKHKCHDIVKLLISHGADVNARYKDTVCKYGTSDKYNTPIMYAIENNDGAMTKFLISRGASVKDSPYLLNTAAMKANAGIVEILLQQVEIDLNGKDENGDTALHSLTRWENGTCPEGCKCVQLVRANIAKSLLSKGASIKICNNEYLTPLYTAVGNSCVEVFKAFLQYNANVDFPINDSFLHPSNSRLCSESEMILNKKFRINRRNKKGQTLLHMAIECNSNSAIFSLLIALGADIDCKDHSGKTPIDIAFSRYYKHFFISLVKNGSDLCTPNSTKIHKAEFDMRCPTFLNLSIEATVRQHIIKMKTAGRFVSEEWLKLVKNTDSTLCEFRTQCEKEIEEMTKVEISSNVSFRNIVTGNVHQLTKYARNKSVVRALESTDYAEKFPIYCNLLERQFRRGQGRKKFVRSEFQLF